MFARVSCEFETNFGKLQETRRWRVRVFFLPWFPSGDFVGRGEGRVFDRDREAYIHTVSSRCWDASFVCGGASWGVYVRCFAVRFFFFCRDFWCPFAVQRSTYSFCGALRMNHVWMPVRGGLSSWLLSWYARLVVRGLAVVVRPFAAQIDWVFLGAPQKAEGLKVVLFSGDNSARSWRPLHPVDAGGVLGTCPFLTPPDRRVFSVADNWFVLLWFSRAVCRGCLFFVRCGRHEAFIRGIEFPFSRTVYRRKLARALGMHNFQFSGNARSFSYCNVFGLVLRRRRGVDGLHLESSAATQSSQIVLPPEKLLLFAKLLTFMVTAELGQ